MLVGSKNLIGLKVETMSGKELGHIKDFDININSLIVEKFYVRPEGVVKGLVIGKLVINKNSIISINEEKMIVEDLMEKELVEALPANTFS